CAQACRKQFEQSASPHQRLQSRALVDSHGPKHPTQPFRPRKNLKEHSAQDPVGHRAGVIALDLGACGFDQFVVLHSRGTRRQARHAAETVVHMVDERRIELDLPLFFQAELHQVDAPARRVHLLAPKCVGRTSSQTEAAVHTLIDQVGRRRMVRIESSAARIGIGDRRFGHQIPPMNRPGFSTPAGSNCALTLFITGNASPELPQTSSFAFTSKGQRSTESEPPRTSRPCRSSTIALRKALTDAPSRRSHPAPTACATSRQRKCACSATSLTLSKNVPILTGSKG